MKRNLFWYTGLDDLCALWIAPGINEEWRNPHKNPWAKLQLRQAAWWPSCHFFFLPLLSTTWGLCLAPMWSELDLCVFDDQDLVGIIYPRLAPTHSFGWGCYLYAMWAVFLLDRRCDHARISWLSQNWFTFCRNGSLCGDHRCLMRLAGCSAARLIFKAAAVSLVAWLLWNTFLYCFFFCVCVTNVAALMANEHHQLVYQNAVRYLMNFSSSTCPRV